MSYTSSDLTDHTNEEKEMKFIGEIDLANKTVYCRCDYNVPLDENRNIIEDWRIRASLPTIRHALGKSARVVVISHLGRPKGNPVPEMSLAPVARRLSELLEKEVALLPDCIGDEVRSSVKKMKPGEIVMLENLRFHPEETKNDDAFARELAAGADVYINDAFGNAHRSHASNVGIVRHVAECGIGYLMKSELDYFEAALENPVRPFVAVLGGSKVSDKLEAIENLSKRVDKLIIGGGMAFTFLKASGFEVGCSLVENNLIEAAQRGMDKAKEKGVKLYFPVDAVIAQKPAPGEANMIVPVQEIPEDWMGLDIGPASTRLFAEVLADAKTVVWNGPMGVFEIDAFSRGTYAMAHAIAETHAMTVIGGGDTDAAVQKAGESENMTFISTGGGAFLWLMQGHKLPSIEALERHESSRG